MEIGLIILLAAWFIITTALIHREQALVSTVVLVVVFGTIGITYGIKNSIEWVASYEFSLLGVVLTLLLYTALGVVWSFYKWYTYLRKNRERFLGGKIENIDKTVIGTWIAYWPFSVFAYLLGDLLADFTKWIVRTFEGVYNRIAVRALK